MQFEVHIICLTSPFPADLGDLGNYPGSPFMHSDSDILLDPQEDLGTKRYLIQRLHFTFLGNLGLMFVALLSVEEFFVDSDSIPGQCIPSDEEKP